MLSLLILLSFTTSFAQEDLEYYIKRWRYKAIESQSKKPALFKLGEKLFKDKGLSGKKNISCHSCHSPEGFSGDALPLGLGEGAEGLGAKRMQRSGLILGRHTQSLYNLGQPANTDYFWDGRVAKHPMGGWVSPEPKFNGNNPELEDVAKTFDSPLALQTIFALVSPEEMMGKESNLTRLEGWEQVMRSIFEGPEKTEYQRLFRSAFPLVKQHSIAHVGNALGEFIRHEFFKGNTPWDQYLRGKKDALTERMKKGAVLFHSRANCVFCHNGNQFTNVSYADIAIPQLNDDDKGRFNVTKKSEDLYAFRVPPLRNVGVTAPYMHSGVFKNLEEVVEHYSEPVASFRNFRWDERYNNYRSQPKLDTNGARNDAREKNISRMLARKLTLNDEEKKDLICFVGVALTDVSLQKVLIKKGVLNEISDCSPRSR